jgi:hypothetical protein
MAGDFNRDVSNSGIYQIRLFGKDLYNVKKKPRDNTCCSTQKNPKHTSIADHILDSAKFTPDSIKTSVHRNKFPASDHAYVIAALNERKSSGGKRKVRKHRGIIQTGGNTGRLRKGYKYTGRRLKNGKAEIVRVKRN